LICTRATPTAHALCPHLTAIRYSPFTPTHVSRPPPLPPQEWNICRGALQRLVIAGLLSQEELEACVVSQYNPVRVGLRGMAQDVWVRDVMNLGVHPG
jgi:hypothetical protein